MAFRFADSFDHYTTTAQMRTKWTSVDTNVYPVAAAGRNGTAGIAGVTGGGSSIKQFKKTLDNQATWIVGIAVKMSAATSHAGFAVEFLDGGTVQVGVYNNTDLTLEVRRNGSSGTLLATSTNSLTVGTYYYIEFKAIIDNAGTYEVRVNGTSTGWIPSASGDTQQSVNAYANVININTISGLGLQHVYDDLYICDGTTGEDPTYPNNSFLGDIRVAMVLPNEIGTYSEFTPTAGNNYTCVDETTPNDDTDYVYTSGVGNVDTYGFAALPVTSGTILGIQTVPYARKDDAGSRSISSTLYYNSILYSGSPKSLGDTYSYYPEIFETNPNTEERWTISEINAAEFGEKLES